MNTGILWDCHMHSLHSFDSHSPMESMILKSIQKGLKGICFTEHLDPDYPWTPDGLAFSLDIPAFKKELFSLREKYAPQISVLFGVELGLQPHLTEKFHKLLGKEAFDFIIGSSHVVHGKDPYYPGFFENRTESECYLEYFSSVLENLKVTDSIDTYGHLDYIVRYGPNQNRNYAYEPYKEILDEILKTLIRKNVGLEVNTGGYHYGLKAPNPCSEIIRRYGELGGEMITIGADAHTPDKIAFAFDQAAELLRSCNFRYYAVFKERKPVFYKL